MSKTRVVVVDLDNTLYDWVGFYVPALLAMVDTLSESLSEGTDVILKQLSDVYRDHGSLEYAFAVQALPVTRRLSPREAASLVRRVRGVFATARDQHLRPYEGVPEALREIRKSGTLLVGATNAPLFQAQRRLRHLDVIEEFHGIAARTSFEIPSDDPAIVDVVDRARNGVYDCTIPRQWGLALPDLKPSTRMYETVLRDLGVAPADALVVGDSVQKDVMPAVRLGGRGAWARYGTWPRPEHLRVLLQVTPWSSSGVSQQYDDAVGEEVPALDSFTEVLALL